MAVKDSTSGNKHVSLCLFTNGVDYTYYVISAYNRSTHYASWNWFEDEKAAIDTYNAEYDRLFKK